MWDIIWKSRRTTCRLARKKLLWKMSRFHLIEVNQENLESLRLIRNECRWFMTRNNSEISKEQQISWFENLDKKVFMPFIFKKDRISIGYGTISIDDKTAWLTGGLLPQYRDQGYGSILFGYLIEKSRGMNKSIELEVLKDNPRALKTYQKLGFKITLETEKIYKMTFLEA